MQFFCNVLAIVFYSIAVEGIITQKQFTNVNLNNNAYVNHGDILKSILFSVREIARLMKQGVSNKYCSGYKDDRPENSKESQNLLNELVTRFQLGSHLKPSTSPPPPYQFVNVKYPVATTFNHTVVKTPSEVSTAEQNPAKETINRHSKDTPKNIGTNDDDDGSRPVLFKPKEPKIPHIQPPPFEHGSTQAGIQARTRPTLIQQESCSLGVLSCCGTKTKEERNKCFAFYKCPISNETELSCNPHSLQMVLKRFSKTYGP